MKIIRLTVNNYGLFSGIHRFELAPVSRGLSPRPLILFSGHNGAGKTTLFSAIPLALYGSLSLGSRVSAQQYQQHLLNRLHRRKTGVSGSSTNSAAIEVEFEFIESGRPATIDVIRRWERNGHSVQEKLQVFINKKLPEVAPEDYQAWLNDLFPPGLLPICFFDAEHLESLSSPEQHQAALAGILHRLLGLDLVRRLQEDLDFYTLRRGGLNKGTHLRQKAIQHQSNIDLLKEQLNRIQGDIEALDKVRDGLETALRRQEDRLQAEGGDYAARRPVLQKRLVAVNEEAESIAADLHNLSSDLLPFALVPELCARLDKRLIREADIHRRQIADGLWQEKVDHFAGLLKTDDFWQEIELPEAQQVLLTNRLTEMLRQFGSSDGSGSEPILHRLAEPERQKLQEWIRQAVNEIPEQAQALGKKHRTLQEEQRAIETELDRAPDDDVLAPIHMEIQRIQNALKEADRHFQALDQERRSVAYKCEEEERQLHAVDSQIAQIATIERQVMLAERSKQALRDYQDALTRQRLTALEESIVCNFNRICQKEHFLTQVSIDPVDFNLILLSADNHKLSLNDFSAGERQLYAMSLLEALRQASGRQLPLCIDTPLARMDEEHRTRLIDRYLPNVSHQVLLFATDAELDNGLLAQAKPYIASIHRLRFDPESQQTVSEVETPYFHQEALSVAFNG